jgi:hypothetical protein
MPFSSGPVLGLVSLIKIELPGHTIRFCDGGFITFDGEDYTSEDAVFGTIGGAEVPEERGADEAAGATLTLLPPSGTAAETLCDPAHQNARVRVWLAEFDVSTGQVVPGSAELLANMRIDVPTLKLARSTRSVIVELMDAGQRLFLIDRGNTLSPRFHKSIWPGEQGFDNATGIAGQVAWGVKGPPRGTTVVGSGGGGVGGNGGGGGRFNQVSAS